MKAACPIIATARIGQSGRPLMSNLDSCKIISKSEQRFRRRFIMIFYEFLHVRIVQKAPIHQSHVCGRIKILRTIFENSQTRNIPVKLFQNLPKSFGEEDFLRISSYSARSPHSPEPYFWMDQNFANSF